MITLAAQTGRKQSAKRRVDLESKLRGTVPFADCNASIARNRRLIEEFFLGLLLATVDDTDAKVMSTLLVIGPAKGNRIKQILSAINYRFLAPNSR